MDSGTGNQVAEMDFGAARDGVSACQVIDTRVKICGFDWEDRREKTGWPQAFHENHPYQNHFLSLDVLSKQNVCSM